MLLYADKRFTSPYAMSVFVVLTEKQLPFEIRTLDLDAGANNDPAYARTSLTQRVPTLIDGDFALSESSAIAEYLDDAFPDPPILPSGRPADAGAGPSGSGLAAQRLHADPPGASDADHLLPAAHFHAAFRGGAAVIAQALCGG